MRCGVGWCARRAGGRGLKRTVEKLGDARIVRCLVVILEVQSSNWLGDRWMCSSAENKPFPDQCVPPTEQEALEAASRK